MEFQVGFFFMQKEFNAIRKELAQIQKDYSFGILERAMEDESLHYAT